MCYIPRIYMEPRSMERDTEGRFELKGDEPRILRSMRLTDTCYEALRESAKQRGSSIADYLESLVENDLIGEESNEEFNEELIDSLMEILDSLEPGEDPLIELNSRDKAPARRVIRAVIEYLS